jgi:hypothetical protein
MPSLYAPSRCANYSQSLLLDLSWCLHARGEKITRSFSQICLNYFVIPESVSCLIWLGAFVPGEVVWGLRRRRELQAALVARTGRNGGVRVHWGVRLHVRQPWPCPCCHGEQDHRGQCMLVLYYAFYVIPQFYFISIWFCGRSPYHMFTNMSWFNIGLHGEWYMF